MAKFKQRSNTPVKKQIWGRELEYIMPKEMYDNLCSEAPSNVNKRDWVMNYINETYGSIENYLINTLDVDIEKLKENYLI